MSGAKSYADFGIPAPVPCPSWCDGVHAVSDAGPGRAVIFHGGSAIGGAVLGRLMEETRDARQAGPAAAR